MFVVVQCPHAVITGSVHTVLLISWRLCA